MKKYSYYTLMVLVSALFIITSCQDTYTVHEEFIQDKDIVYSNKVDSLVAYAGKSRVKIEGYIYNAFNVKEIIVEWNKGENEQIFPYTKSSEDNDFLEFFIENLEEKSYIFKVYSVDVNNNRSLKKEVFQDVFGDIYRSRLSARLLTSVSYNNSNGSATVNFAPIGSFKTQATEIKYINSSQEEVTVMIDSDQNSIVLDNIDDLKPLEYRTNYIPTETALDGFASDWETFESPTSTDILDLLETYSIESIIGGAKVNWENATNLELNFSFQKNVGGDLVIDELGTSIDSMGSYDIRGMDNGAQDISIIISDLSGNSWVKTYNVTPIGQLDKSGWSVIDFTSEDGGDAAVKVIDGTIEGFWQSDWRVPNEWPYHVTIDMQATKTVLAFEIFRRLGQYGVNSAGVHEFYLSDDAITWTKVATHAGQVTEENKGTLVELETVSTGRYIKYVAAEGAPDKPGDTSLAELNVFGE